MKQHNSRASPHSNELAIEKDQELIEYMMDCGVTEEEAKRLDLRELRAKKQQDPFVFRYAEHIATVRGNEIGRSLLR